MVDVPVIGLKLTNPGGIAPCTFQLNVTPGVELFRLTATVF